MADNTQSNHKYTQNNLISNKLKTQFNKLFMACFSIPIHIVTSNHSRKQNTILDFNVFNAKFLSHNQLNATLSVGTELSAKQLCRERLQTGIDHGSSSTLAFAFA